jgi:hypothetical protein
VNQKETNCLVYFWVFAGDGDSHRRRRKTEVKKTLQTPWFLWSFQQRRVNPRAASGGARGTTRCQWRGAWNNAPPLFQRFWKGSQHCYDFFRGCFCNCKLSDVICFFCLVLNFYYLSGGCKKKRKEKKNEKKQNYRESVCVCLYVFFYGCFYL